MVINSKRKGSIAVGEAISYFLQNNESVFLPVSDCDKYDLVVDKKSAFKKIQCKYSNDKTQGGGFILDLRTFGGYREKTYHNKYLKDDFDLLFIYCSDGSRYLIPAENVWDKSQIVVGNKSWNKFKL
jgi:hypothetical protein